MNVPNDRHGFVPQWTNKPGEHRKWQRDLSTHSQIILKHNLPYREKEAERKKLAELSEAA